MSTQREHWKDEASYNATHARRFELSLEALRPLLRPRMKILELGGYGSFTWRLLESPEFKPATPTRVGDPLDAEIIEHAADLRYVFDKADAAFDAVLCMEVFEHIHDQEADKPTEWRATGTDNLLAETFRVLKPGGWLFLTTPNACSFNVLEKILTMQPPMMYRPHVREYAPAEIDQALKAHGFRIESFTTHDCWGGGCSGLRRRELEALLARASCQSPHRGECIFVIARKP